MEALYELDKPTKKDFRALLMIAEIHLCVAGKQMWALLPHKSHPISSLQEPSKCPDPIQLHFEWHVTKLTGDDFAV